MSLEIKWTPQADKGLTMVIDFRKCKIDQEKVLS